jgi:hypothetical protein
MSPKIVEANIQFQFNGKKVRDHNYMTTATGKYWMRVKTLPFIAHVKSKDPQLQGLRPGAIVETQG